MKNCSGIKVAVIQDGLSSGKGGDTLMELVTAVARVSNLLLQRRILDSVDEI